MDRNREAIRGVIFDLDGTLADTLATIGNAVNYALEQLGLPTHTLEAYKAMVGEGVGVLCQKALPQGQADRLDELVAGVRARYSSHVMDQTRLYDGIAELLAALRARSVLLAVLSNKPHNLTLGTLEGLGLVDDFVCAFGERTGVPKKPDPTAALEVLRLMNLERGQVLYVGDTPIDMQTARAAGLRSVGVLWGFRGRDELLAHGAEHLVAHPREILPLLEQT